MGYDFYVWEFPAPRRLDHARETVRLGKDWVVGPNPKFSDLAERLLRRFPRGSPDSLWAEPPDGTTPHKVMRLSIRNNVPAFRQMLAWSVLDMRRSRQDDSSEGSGIKMPQSPEEKQRANDPLLLSFLEPGIGMAWSADGGFFSEKDDASFDQGIAFTPPREPEENHARLALLRQRTAEAQPVRPVPLKLVDRPRAHLLHAKSNLIRAFLKHEDGWFRALAYRRSETFLRRTWEILGHFEPRRERVSSEHLRSYLAEVASLSLLIIELPLPLSSAEAYYLAIAVHHGQPETLVYSVELRKGGGTARPQARLLQHHRKARPTDLGPVEPSVMALVKRLMPSALGKLGAALKFDWARQPQAGSTLGF